MRGITVVSAVMAMLPLACVPTPEPPVPDDLATIDPGARIVVEKSLEVVRQNPHAAEAWLRLGQVYLAHKMSTEAAASLAHLAEVAPTAEVHTLHAIALDQLGDSAARRIAINNAIAFGGNRTIPLWRAALWALETGEVDRAATMAEKAKAHPEAGYTEPMVLAGVRLAQDRPDEAALLIEPIVQQRPQDGYAHWILGRALLAAGNDAEARRHLRRAGDALPDYYDPWEDKAEHARADFTVRLGQVAAQARARQFAHARQTLQSLEAMYGERRELDLAAATLAFMEGDHDRSTRILTRLIKSWPKWFPPHAQKAQQLLKRAQSLGGRRLIADARNAAETATAISPGKMEGWVLLSRIARLQGDVDTEISSLQQAVELAPERFDLSLQYAESLALGGQPTRAIDVLGEHEDIFGTSLATSLLRVQSLVAAGRGDEARVIFEACERQSPNNPQVLRMKQLLKKAGL
ncbi:MAG: tetratricopeptide repeat protein [Planctomycetes bacterium]|nr:tetratricopeptide repeat protein [Planctomycetota bacterium]MCP4839690.1 tetratricopeptide repeat protein [Planctomycetota bacterium]